MSVLWLEQPHRGWRPHPVPPGALVPGEAVGLPGVGVLGLPRGAALLVRPGTWARVNGEPVLGGLRRLDHRDEVLTTAGRAFYSAERAAAVSTFALAPGACAPTCPVCRGPVRDGAPAVQCPGCGRWAHQADDRPCWAYAPACRFCQHPTALAADAAWRPGREEDLS